MSQITRRTLLAAGFSAAVLGRAGAQADVDVAIVGAGAAGLAAADRVRRAGRSFVLLEARDRIGGRAHTDTSFGRPWDAGAEYIHWGETNPWKRIADELRIPLEEDRWRGRFLVFREGRPLSEDDRNRRRGAFARLPGYIEHTGSVDASFADAVRRGPPELGEAAGGITRMALGEEPDRVSVADYDRLWSGDDYTVPEGYGTLVARYGGGLPVRLSTPATRIRWSPDGVEVETPSGTVRARTAIVTVPLGVLQAGSIRFAPELPAPLQSALDGLGMGALTKLALRVDRSRMGVEEETSLFDLDARGVGASYEIGPLSDAAVLAVFGGDQGRAVCEGGEAAAVAYAAERLGALLGARARQAVRGGRLAAWWTDPWSRGSYSLARPGRAEARAALRPPAGGRLWIAGEATAAEGGAMTVGGAYLEGERAAGEALRALGPP